MSTEITVVWSSCYCAPDFFRSALVKKQLWLKVREVFAPLWLTVCPDRLEVQFGDFFSELLADLKWCYCSRSLNYSQYDVYIINHHIYYTYMCMFMWFIFDTSTFVFQQQLKLGLGLPVVCDLSRHWRHGDSALVSPVTATAMSWKNLPQSAGGCARLHPAMEGCYHMSNEEKGHWLFRVYRWSYYKGIWGL